MKMSQEINLATQKVSQRNRKRSRRKNQDAYSLKIKWGIFILACLCLIDSSPEMKESRWQELLFICLGVLMGLIGWLSQLRCRLDESVRE